ncbi:AtpZ/AtpI family protein [Longibacter sp.]|jgi:F0F1-type ATP synthase assembly protein I|uniref:AtpZ/AtpI family protein n=1 Tax=Longibacter sp. TaxID=2045415 RepID=UPI003EB982CA
MAKGSWQESMRLAGPHIDLGYRIAGAVLIFGGGGVWLDRSLDTEPWLSIAGTVLSFIAILGIIMRFSIEQEQKKETDRKPDPTSGRNGSSAGASG